MAIKPPAMSAPWEDQVSGSQDTKNWEARVCSEKYQKLNSPSWFSQAWENPKFTKTWSFILTIVTTVTGTRTASPSTWTALPEDRSYRTKAPIIIIQGLDLKYFIRKYIIQEIYHPEIYHPKIYHPATWLHNLTGGFTNRGGKSWLLEKLSVKYNYDNCNSVYLAHILCT